MTQTSQCRTDSRMGIAFSALATLILAGCGSGGGGASSPLADEDGILGFVPADTPYVFAAVEGMPDAALDKLEQGSDSMLAAYKTVVASTIEEMAAEGEIEADEEELDLTLSLAESVIDLLQSDSLRSAGVPRGAQMAIYGVGLLPVIRVELSNPVAFEAKIAEIEANIGGDMEVAEAGGQSYRYLELDEAQMLIAVTDDYAVMAMTPAALTEAQLSIVLGVQKPGESIAATKALESLAASYDFTTYGLGYFSISELAETFVGDPSGINADLLTMMDYSAADLPDVCRSDIRAMAGIMPRIVSGYTEVTADQVTSNTVFEMRADLAEGLTAVSAPVPGLGMDHGGLGSFGMSIDALALRSFMEARFDAYEEAPYECELLAGTQLMIDQARLSLNQPVPPVAYSFKGFLAVIDRIEGLDFNGQQPPEVVEARMLVANDNAPALLAMGAMFSPEIASLNLQPDGNPVELPMPQLAAMAEAAHIAMTESALAISVGDGAPERLSELLNSPPSSQQPLFSVRLDGQRYYEFMNEAMKAGNAASGEGDMSEELQNAASTVMTGISDAIDRISVDVILTNRGIELPANVTLRD